MWWYVKYGAGGMAALAATPMIAGFGTAGIVGCSFAAATQAGIGNVVAGSAFAGLQGLGASGALAWTAGGSAATAAAAAATDAYTN